MKLGDGVDRFGLDAEEAMRRHRPARLRTAGRPPPLSITTSTGLALPSRFLSFSMPSAGEQIAGVVRMRHDQRRHRDVRRAAMLATPSRSFSAIFQPDFRAR